MYKEWRKIGFQVGFGATIGVYLGKTVMSFTDMFATHLAKKLIEADDAGDPEIEPEEDTLEDSKK